MLSLVSEATDWTRCKYLHTKLNVVALAMLEVLGRWTQVFLLPSSYAILQLLLFDSTALKPPHTCYNYCIMKLEMIKSGDLLLASSDMQSFPLSHFNSVSSIQALTIWRWDYVLFSEHLQYNTYFDRNSLMQLPYNDLSAPSVASYQMPIYKNELSYIFKVQNFVEYQNTIESELSEWLLILPLLSQPCWTIMNSSVFCK